MEKLKVIADQRERNGELLEGLRGNGIEIEIKTLPVGDFIISDRVCIERKTVSDFESSMMSGRLFEQIKRIKNSYDFPILLLEGDKKEFRLRSKVINGAIASLYIDHGIVAVLSFGPDETAEMIAGIAKHEQDGKAREPSVKGGMRAHSHEQFQEYVIGNLPGVGPKLAKALLKHFGNVKSIANADVDELMEVEKIGRIKAERIKETFTRKYGLNKD